MQVVSKLVDIKKTNSLSTEYVEQELAKQNINPLRWAIVKVNEETLTISVANLI